MFLHAVFVCVLCASCDSPLYCVLSSSVFPHDLAVSAFIICRGLCAFTYSYFVPSNRILPFVYTFSGIFVEFLKVIQSAGMCN